MASEAHEGFSQPLSSGKADLRGWGSILKTPLTLPTTHLQRLITLYKQLSASSYPKNSFLFCWSTSYSHKTGFCYFYISYAIHISCKTHINCATLYELYMLFAVKMGERWTRNWVTRVSMHLPIALLWLLLVRCLKELSFSRKSVVSLQGRERTELWRGEAAGQNHSGWFSTRNRFDQSSKWFEREGAFSGIKTPFFCSAVSFVQKGNV